MSLLYRRVFRNSIFPFLLAITSLFSLLTGHTPFSMPSSCLRDSALVLVLKDAEIVLPLAGVVDLEAEKQRLEKEKEVCQAKIEQLQTGLRDSIFLSQALSSIIKKEEAKPLEFQNRLEKLTERLAQLA